MTDVRAIRHPMCEQISSPPVAKVTGTWNPGITFSQVSASIINKRTLSSSNQPQHMVPRDKSKNFGTSENTSAQTATTAKISILSTKSTIIFITKPKKPKNGTVQRAPKP